MKSFALLALSVLWLTAAAPAMMPVKSPSDGTGQNPRPLDIATETAVPIETSTSAPSETSGSATPTTLPTAVPSATLVESPVPTPTPTARAHGFDTTLVFEDRFNPTGRCSFDAFNDANRRFGCDNGEYVMLSKAGNRFWQVSPYSYSYDDAVVEADARVVSGDVQLTYGLLFRVSQDGRKFYLFALGPIGYYGFAFCDDMTGCDWLIRPTLSAVVKTGLATNHLLVAAQGNQIALYANDQFLESVNDSRLAKGYVGFFLGTLTPNAQVAFDNLAVSQSARPLPLPTPRPRLPTPTPTPVISNRGA